MKRRLKSYVVPVLYVGILMLVFGTVSLVSSFMKKEPNIEYTTGVIKDDVIPVVTTDNNTTDTKLIIKPYNGENVEIECNFYNKNEVPEQQEKSLIYYQNTYMKNTGILYSSDEAFDVLMVLEGKVLSIKDDEILGPVVEIENNNNLRTIYYGLSDVKAKVGDFLEQGDVIGRSSINNISSKQSFLFEVYYNGTLIDPEDFYNMDVTTLN